MQCDQRPEFESAVIQAFALMPGANVHEIASHVGCPAEKVQRTKFYQRVMIARMGREPEAMEDFVASQLPA